MRTVFAILPVVAALILPHPVRAATDPEAVEIHEPNSGSLKAVLFRPDGKGPFPAVIGLHNCTGLQNRNGAIGARYRDWGQRLAKLGFAVLFPDSNGSRKLGSQCSVRSRSVRVDRERVADAEAARAWLLTQPWIEPDRVSLMGWSSGAIAALWAVRARLQPDINEHDFRSAVAFYPGCRRLNNVAWSARVPTLILIGSADDQASAALCQKMVAGSRGRSARVEIHIYPGAPHDFDHPSRPVQVRTGLAYSVDGSGRVHSGTNQAARGDALKRVPEWLER